MSEKHEIEIEITVRNRSGNKCFYGLAKLRSLLIDLKIQLYVVIIRPVIMYGAESWSLIKSVERKLLVLKRKILQTIFEPVRHIK